MNVFIEFVSKKINHKWYSVHVLYFMFNTEILFVFWMQHFFQEFLVRLRTQKVDVDSNGRSCKERMMTVLSQGLHHTLSDEKG